jgi:purine-nucleoside phosphorylase
MNVVPRLASPDDGVPEGIVAAIRERSSIEPVAAIVLGSGLGGVLEVVGDAVGRSGGLEIAYGELPGFPTPSVPGHAGTLWLGELGDRPFVAFLGRIHHYEHPMRMASLTARIAALLGARTIVLTAATGANPLPVSEGVYVAVSGPSYETPAEIEAFRRAGATVVGMSMVPEAVAARALGMRVLGLSFVTNAAGTAVSHEEVLAASSHAVEGIGRVLVELLQKL